MISEHDMEAARILRANYGPMRRADGTLDAQAVAMEQTARDALGLPSYIMELDGPGLGEAPPNGLDHIEGQKMPRDHESDPGDTMPAQGWLTHDPLADMPDRMPAWTDAGRTPAPREEHTMARPAYESDAILTAEVREDFDHAAKRASTIAQFATMHPEQRLEELEARPIRELRELHHAAAGTEAWHEQGAQDARDLSRTIGQVLRAAGDEIDPQAKTEASMGTLR